MFKKIIFLKFKYPDYVLENFVKRGYPWVMDIFFGIFDVINFLLGDLIIKFICVVSILLKIYERITYNAINEDFFSKIKYQAIVTLVWSLDFMLSGYLLFCGIQSISPMNGVSFLFCVVISIIFTILIKIISAYVQIRISQKTRVNIYKTTKIFCYVLLIILYPTLIFSYISMRFNNSSFAYSLAVILSALISSTFFGMHVDKALVFFNRNMLRDYINHKTTDNKTNQE